MSSLLLLVEVEEDVITGVIEIEEDMITGVVEVEELGVE